MSGEHWRDALDAARDSPDGEAKIAELERIVAHADAAGEIRLGVHARLALVETYRFRGERWRLVEPLHHCLATVDRHRTLFDADDLAALRAHQRTAVAAATDSPRIGLDQTRMLLDDLAGRLDRTAPGTVAELRCRLADQMGDEPVARDWFARWRAAGPGDGCAACTAVRQAGLLAGWGEWAEAVRLLEPLTTEPGGCTEQPEAALAALLLPYLRLGRHDDAGRAHVRAYRRHRREWTAFAYLPAHLEFCALGGHPARGVEILFEQLPRLAGAVDERCAMEFTATAALLCRLAAEAGVGHPSGPVEAPVVRMPGRTLGLDHATRLAEAFGLVRVPPSGGGPSLAALGADLLATATDLAGRFDARNGTGHQTGRITARLADRPLTTAPPPLPAAGDPDPVEPVHPQPDDAGLSTTGSEGALSAIGPGSTGLSTTGPGGAGLSTTGPGGAGLSTTGPGGAGLSTTGPGGAGLDGPQVAGADGDGTDRPDVSRAVDVPPDEPAPLTVAMIVSAVERRGERCAVEPGGTVVGRWGEAMIRFERVGTQAEILHARVVATRRLPADRRAEAYEFVNAWNRDRLLPKAYVHEVPGSELVLAGDVTTDLAHGVAPVQLEVLVEAAVSTGAAYAEAVAALP